MKFEDLPAMIRDHFGDLLRDDVVAFLAGLDVVEYQNFLAMVRKARQPTKAITAAVETYKRRIAEEAAKAEAARAEEALRDSDFDRQVEALKRLGVADRTRLTAEPIRQALAALWLDRLDIAQSVMGYWRTEGVADVAALERQVRKDADALRVARMGQDGAIVPTYLTSLPELFSQITKVIHELMPDQLFLRNGELVRVKVMKEKKVVEGAILSPGYCHIVLADPDWLGYRMQTGGAQFMAMKKDGPEEIAPPGNLLKRYLNVPDAHRMPYLRTLSTLPTITRSAPGYDAESEVFLAFPHGTFPEAPASPTKTQAKAALNRIGHPLRDYCFLDDASRAAGLSVLLAAVLRPSMRTCPMHAVTGQEAGLGKTKFAVMADVLQRAEDGVIVGLPPTDEELEKRLATLLLMNLPNICFDNVTRRIDDDALCRMLTSNPWTTRKLGGNELLVLDTTSLIIATGTKLRIEGDMRRRSVVCTLTTGGRVHVEDRQHVFDPVEEVKENRRQLVMDALTVIRGWIGASRPLPADFRAMNSFADYSMIRGALLWLGEADPAETNAELYETDAEADERSKKVQALYDHFGERAFLAREIEDQKLLAALELYRADPRDTGCALRNISDAPAGDLVLMQVGKRDNCRLWQVRRIVKEGIYIPV
jgi:hypothetical protein